MTTDRNRCEAGAVDDCHLVSAGRDGAERLWLYTNGADAFVALPDVTDVWEIRRSH